MALLANKLIGAPTLGLVLGKSVLLLDMLGMTLGLQKESNKVEIGTSFKKYCSKIIQDTISLITRDNPTLNFQPFTQL
jgi:hypothetical protein